MDSLEAQKQFFYPVSTQAEIERIFDPKDSQDYLLKIRGETIVDNIRLYRVYRHKAMAAGESWSLESSFSNKHWYEVIEKLPPSEKKACQEITYGDVFSNDPNGMIFCTEYGPIATLCDSIRFFTKFANLALLEFESEVPGNVRMNALRISMRVMLKTETMDFAVDPRGILPENIAEEIHRPIPWMSKFITGHEFAHYFLGHLSSDDLVEQPIFCATGEGAEDYSPKKVYNTSQKNEFEADLQSILTPNYNNEELCEILAGALLWLTALDLYQHVSDVICPKAPHRYQTHPSAADRFDSLLVNIPTPKGFDISSWSRLPSLANQLKDILTEDIGFNIEAYEMYGSIYLDRPNSEWRGRELKDRVDY